MFVKIKKTKTKNTKNAHIKITNSIYATNLNQNQKTKKKIHHQPNDQKLSLTFRFKNKKKM